MPDDSTQHDSKGEKAAKEPAKKSNFRYSYKKNNALFYVIIAVVVIAVAGVYYWTSGQNNSIVANNSIDTSENQTASTPPAVPSLNETTGPIINATPNEPPPQPRGGLGGTTIAPEENATPPIPPAPVQQTQGLTAIFYSSINLAGNQSDPVVIPVINLTWNDTSDPAPGFSWKRFSAQFTGKLKIALPGKYIFFIASDDGSRLYLDGNDIADIWENTGMSTASSYVKTLDAGTYDIKIDYRNIGGGAAKLRLEYQSADLNIAKQLIPSSMLMPA